MAATARILSLIYAMEGTILILIHSPLPNQHLMSIDVSAAPSFSDVTVPDGGFGWIIVLSSAVQTFIFYGITSNCGIFRAALVD